MENNEIIKEIEQFRDATKGFASKEQIEKVSKAVSDIENRLAKTAANESDKHFGNVSGRQEFAKFLASGMIKNNQTKGGVEGMLKAANLNSTDVGLGAKFEPYVIDGVINKLVGTYGLGRNECRRIPNIHGTIGLRNRTARPQVSYNGTAATAAVPGTNTDNRADLAIPLTGPTYGNSDLSPKQAGAITILEEKLLHDAPVDFVTEAGDGLAEAAAYFEDYILLNGAGDVTSAGFTGIKGNSNIASATLTAANANSGSSAFISALLTMPGLVDQTVVGDSKWYMGQTVFYTLLGSKTSGSGQFVLDLSSNSYAFGGFSVVRSQAMDSTLTAGKMPVMFGNLKKTVALGTGRDYELRALSERYADIGCVGIRMLWDFAYQYMLTQALSKIVLS